MDEIFSRVDVGKFIQAALIKAARNKHKTPHTTDYRINRDCVVNLFQANILFLYPLIASVGRKMEHRLETC